MRTPGSPPIIAPAIVGPMVLKISPNWLKSPEKTAFTASKDEGTLRVSY
nr:hypothetical protein [Bacillus thuringiensis]